MLSRLLIRNYALIEETEIIFGPGLNTLTGETGAGKSLLLGAIGLILGKRADSSVIFDPSKKCIVEAEFAGIPKGIWEELGQMEAFDLEEKLNLRREVDSQGKSRAFINDTPVSLTVLKQVTGMVVDLTGQHENQLLTSSEHQIRLLDEFCGTRGLALDFALSLQKWAALKEEILRWREEEKNGRQQLDYVQFQFDELHDARLDEAEEANLENELSLLENAEELTGLAAQGTEALYQSEQSLYNQLSRFLSDFARGARIHEDFRSIQERLEEVRGTLKEAAFDLSHTADRIDQDPGRLKKLQERRDVYNRLFKKFGVNTVLELIELREGFAAKLGTFSSLEGKISSLEKTRISLEKELVEKGISLEKGRQQGIPALAQPINSLLKEVGLEEAEFSVLMDRIETVEGGLEIEGKRFRVNSNGVNQVSFQIRTNKGMPSGPLGAIASGGEVSRVMLAIKAALAEKAELSVLIFDEIDTGISGETARKVGRVMQGLGARYQVIAITHLPQIAGMGRQHFLVKKSPAGNRTLSSVKEITGEDRVMEVAKMLSGEKPTESALKNARELITSHQA